MIEKESNKSKKSKSDQYMDKFRVLLVLLIGVIIFATFGYLIHTRDRSDANNQHEIVQHVIENTEAMSGNASEIELDEGNENMISSTPQVPMWEKNEEIEIFREYLRIPTVHPDIDYRPAVAFLEKQAANLGLSGSIHYPVDDKNPIVVITWEGLQPELPSIILNSHMDVVPVYEEFWTHPPFAAEMDENGNIFARGAQDTKSAGMQYLAAIRSLKREGVERLKRTVHVVFVPDEEVGGARGMGGFIKTDEFRALNVAFVLDEGNEEVDGVLYAYYGERTVWQLEFIVHGQSGHGSRLFENTPGEKISNLLAKLNEFRKEEMRKLNELKYPYGNVTSINLTILKGGVQANVVPAEMSATFDMRISVNADLDEFEQQLNRWCEEVGGDISINFLSRAGKEKMTVVDDSNPFWVAFKSAVDEMGLLVEPSIFIGASDSACIRRLNISAIGFSPLLNTIGKRHDHDEYLNADTFLNGIGILKKIIVNLSDV